MYINCLTDFFDIIITATAPTGRYISKEMYKTTGTIALCILIVSPISSIAFNNRLLFFVLLR
jgi:hypothetical protein